MVPRQDRCRSRARRSSRRVRAPYGERRVGATEFALFSEKRIRKPISAAAHKKEREIRLVCCACVCVHSCVSVPTNMHLPCRHTYAHANARTCTSLCSLRFRADVVHHKPKPWMTAPCKPYHLGSCCLVLLHGGSVGCFANSRASNLKSHDRRRLGT